MSFPNNHFANRKLPKVETPKVGDIWVDMNGKLPIERRALRITEAFNVQTGKVTFIRLWNGQTYGAQLKSFSGSASGYAPLAWFETTYKLKVPIPAGAHS